MRFEDCQRLFHTFDPFKPLRADTAALYVPRADSVVDEFRQQMRFQTNHRFLLAGAVGSGKSTELFRMLEGMAGNTSYTTKLIGLEELFDVRSLTAAQILYIAAASILAGADLADGDRTGLYDKLRTAYSNAAEEAGPTFDLGKFLNGLAVMAAAAAGGPIAGAAAGTAAAAADGLGTRLALPGKGLKLAPNDPRARALYTLLSEIIRAARERSGKRYLLLIDGLDKVDDDQIGDLFGGGILACPDVGGLDLVIAGPPSLRFQVGHGGGVGFEMLRLGLFNIVHRDGSVNPVESQAMMQLVERRAELAGLDPDQVLPPNDRDGQGLNLAIQLSGGLVRDLMHILRRAVTLAADDPQAPKLSTDHLAAGADRRAKDYLDKLNLEREDVLKSTWTERQRPGGDLSDKLLNDNFILCYDNGDPWCRPHPLVMARLRTRFPEIGFAGSARADLRATAGDEA